MKRYTIAEKTGEESYDIIKNLSFNKFDSACKIAARLSQVHQATEYLVIDTLTNTQYNITALL